MNQDLKLIALHDKLSSALEAVEADLRALQLEAGPQGPKGEKGDRGPKGEPGTDGADGVGIAGKDGEDGEDGVSITDVNVDFDNHLVVQLSDGNTIDAGEILTRDDGGRTIINRSGSNSSGGGGIKYTEVLTTTYTVQESDLIVGHNIYGVDSGGDSVVYLPTITDPTKIVVVSNEMTGTSFIVTTQAL